MSGTSNKYVPPHRRGRGGGIVDDVLHNSIIQRPILEQAIQRAYCINLESRKDKWSAFQESALLVSTSFQQKIERFNAVNGYAIEDDSISPEDIKREWDVTTNAKYSKKTHEQKMLYMSDGEVGCALSHIALWRKLVAVQGDPHETNMLILEDDCEFVNYKGRDRLAVAFERVWKALPTDWAILYLGISARGERRYVDNLHTRGPDPKQRSNRRRDPMDPEIQLFRPEYGYHTHAYMITKFGAQRLLDSLPVSGPIDVWLADNHWFDLPVYCAVIANEGWKNEDGTFEGIQLVHQVRRGPNFKSDVQPPS